MSIGGAPFAKKPSSQYQRPEFYWRGGDELHEREYLADQYKKALTEYRKADFELKQVEQELADAHETLHDREGYTSALANYLDADIEGASQEIEYKKKLAELEQEIKDAEQELASVRAVHHPAVASSLQKEKAYLMIEMQRTTKSIELVNESQNNAKRQLAACTINKKYELANDLQIKYEQLARKKAFLRTLVNKNKKDFDNTKPVVSPQSDEAKTARAALTPQIELDQTIQREEEKKQRRPRKYENYIHHLIDFIEEQNERLTDLGLESEIIDTDALREKYFPDQKHGDDEPNDDDQPIEDNE